MLIIGRREVEELLDPAKLIDAVATALIDLSAGCACDPRDAVLADRGSDDDARPHSAQDGPGHGPPCPP